MQRISASLALFCFVSGAAAQTQFSEKYKGYAPHVRFSSRSVDSGDVDADGDRDLLLGSDAVLIPDQSRLFLNDGTGRFTDATLTHLPASFDLTLHVLLHDLDADGDLDAVLSNEEQDGLWLNDGTGHFADATATHLPFDNLYTWASAAADVDGDLDMDLVLGGYGAVKLYLNDGTAHFADVTTARVPLVTTDSESVLLEDFDGDNDLDIVVGTYHGQSRFLQNNGSGTFSDATVTRMPVVFSRTARVVAADFDGDSDLDLAFAEWLVNHQLYLNNGQGVFTNASATNLPAYAGGYCWGLRAGDVDGDGDPDLAFAHYGQEQLYLNNGSGVFTDATATRLPQDENITIDAELQDLDGDSDLDLFCAVLNQPCTYYANDGNGRFSDLTPHVLQTAITDTLAVALGDIDGDGDLDLAYGNSGSNSPEFLTQDELYRNDGWGSFTRITDTHLPADADDARAVVFVDVDNDLDQDLVIGNALQQNRLYLNNGSGLFSDATTGRLPVDSNATLALAAADFDNDGDKDLICGNFDQQSRLYRNNGSGVFTDMTATALPARLDATRAIAVGDIDGDLDLDLVFGIGLVAPSQNRVYRNNGSGVFTDVTATQITAFLTETASVALGDIDGDHDLDLVCGTANLTYGYHNLVYFNDGAGGFTLDFIAAPYRWFQTRGIALSDADLDGDLDMFCGDYDRSTKLYLNNGSGLFLDASNARMPSQEQSTLAIAVGDVDHDGDPDLVCANGGFLISEGTVYFNRHRHVDSATRPQVGKSHTFDFYARPGYAPAGQLALPLLSFGALPFPISLPPLGWFGLDPATLVVLPVLAIPAGSGKTSVTMAVPPDPTLAGAGVHVQAVFLQGPVVVLSGLLSDRIIL